MPRLTSFQWLLAICSIVLVAVLPATISYSQAFSAEPLVLAVAKELRSWGWDVTIPEWAPFVIPPAIGLLLFIILIMQLRQQQRAAILEGDQMPPDRPDSDRPPPPSFNVGQNYGQVAGANYGQMHQTVNFRKMPRVLSPATVERARAVLPGFKSLEVEITSMLSDAESYELSDALWELLKSVGWKLEGLHPNRTMYSGPILEIQVQTPAAAKPAMDALASCLLLSNIGGKIIVDDSVPKPHIIVGQRP